MTDIEQGEGNLDADEIQLPTTMKVVGADGKVVTKALGLATKTIVCCGCPKPPGGWYGPFGFLRIISYIFMAVAAVSVLFVLLAIHQGDVLGVLSSLVLAVVAAVCALAAYAHEGLANEVTEMARQNDRYAEKNVRLAKQIDELAAVEARFKTFQESMGLSVEDLKKKLGALHKLTATSQLTAILKAFVSADSECGNRDRALQREELEDFFDTAKPIFTQAAPDFDFAKLVSEALDKGPHGNYRQLDMNALHVLVNAVISGSDDKVGKCTAMLNLVLFSFDPCEHIETCLDTMTTCLKSHGYTRIGLKAMLETRAEPWEGSQIPAEAIMDVSKEIMLCDKDRKGRPLITETTKFPKPGKE